MTKKIAPVAREGDRLKTLQALRDRLAEELDDCTSKRDIASISNRLMEVLAQIAELNDDEGEVDPVAELIALPGSTR